MKTIWKYPVRIADLQTVVMPKGGYTFTAQMQGGELYIWALVDPLQEPSPVTIRIFGTGTPVPEFDGQFLGTVQTPFGFVWHVFRDVS